MTELSILLIELKRVITSIHTTVREPIVINTADNISTLVVISTRGKFVAIAFHPNDGIHRKKSKRIKTRPSKEP